MNSTMVQVLVIFNFYKPQQTHPVSPLLKAHSFLSLPTIADFNSLIKTNAIVFFEVVLKSIQGAKK